MPENENTSLVADKNAPEAILEINSIDDAEVLKSIVDTDTRVTVKAAAEKRLVELTSDASEPAGSIVYAVDIPGSATGPQYVLASSEDEALEKYKAGSGITKHRNPASVVATELDPESPTVDPAKPIVLFGEIEQGTTLMKKAATDQPNY